MTITERQQKILNILVQEYIRKAEPISSDFLEKKYKMGISPATIRNELQKLNELGYLEQPYFSSGRIPTNKAYRFFVDHFLKLNHIKENSLISDKIANFLKRADYDRYKTIEFITKVLSLSVSGLTITYLYKKDILLKEGWKKVFQNPEFKENDYLEGFFKAIENFEKKIGDFCELCEENKEEINVFIGKERPFLGPNSFSLIISGTTFFKNEDILLGILGPKRMNYNKNINIIHSLIKRLEKL